MRSHDVSNRYTIENENVHLIPGKLASVFLERERCVAILEREPRKSTFGRVKINVENATPKQLL